MTFNTTCQAIGGSLRGPASARGLRPKTSGCDCKHRLRKTSRWSENQFCKMFCLLKSTNNWKWDHLNQPPSTRLSQFLFHPWSRRPKQRRRRQRRSQWRRRQRRRSQHLCPHQPWRIKATPATTLPSCWLSWKGFFLLRVSFYLCVYGVLVPQCLLKMRIAKDLSRAAFVRRIRAGKGALQRILFFGQNETFEEIRWNRARVRSLGNKWIRCLWSCLVEHQFSFGCTRP